MEADEQLVPKRGNKGSVIRKFYGYRERGAGNPNMQSVQKKLSRRKAAAPQTWFTTPNPTQQSMQSPSNSEQHAHLLKPLNQPSTVENCAGRNMLCTSLSLSLSLSYTHTCVVVVNATHVIFWEIYLYIFKSNFMKALVSQDFYSSLHFLVFAQFWAALFAFITLL